MTVFDLFDSIGSIDDELIERAKQPKKPHKRLFLIIGSLAACSVILCMGLFLWRSRQNNTEPAITSSSVYETGGAVKSENLSSVFSGSGEESGVVTSGESPHTEASIETAPEETELEIYYTANKRLEHKTTKTAAVTAKVFELWKSENHIGKEVKLISADLSYSDSGTSVYEYSGVKVAAHQTSGTTVYTLKVTKNIENYCDASDSGLLFEALRKTMTGMSDIPPDDYELVLVDEDDGTLPEESENNRINPDEIRYNENGEILE